MWAIGIIAFFVWGIPVIKFIIKRLWFAFRLFLKSTFCKGFEYCYKTPFSIFAFRRNKNSDVLIYYGGTVYIIKLCGVFRKFTDIIVHDNDFWQIDTYIGTGYLFRGTKNTDTEKVLFNLPREKELFESNIWSVSGIRQINTMLLLLPKPKAFGIRVETYNEWLCSGNLCGGNIVGTAMYFWRTIRELKEESENFMYVDEKQWELIKKEYKKAEWN